MEFSSEHAKRWPFFELEFRVLVFVEGGKP